MIGYIVQWENMDTDECPDIDDGSTSFADSITPAIALYDRMARNRLLDVKLWMATDLKPAASSEVFDAEVRAMTQRGGHGWHLERFTDRRKDADINLYAVASWATLMMLTGDIMAELRRGGAPSIHDIRVQLAKGNARDAQRKEADRG